MTPFSFLTDEWLANFARENQELAVLIRLIHARPWRFYTYYDNYLQDVDRLERTLVSQTKLYNKSANMLLKKKLGLPFY